MAIENKVGAMLPLMAMIMIVFGVTIPSAFIIHSLANSATARAKFYQNAEDFISEVEEAKLFYEEMVKFAAEEAISDKYGGTDQICAAKLINNNDLKSEIKVKINEWAEHYGAYEGTSLQGVDSIDLIISKEGSISKRNVGTYASSRTIVFDEEIYISKMTVTVKAGGETGMKIKVEAKNSQGDVVCSHDFGWVKSQKEGEATLNCYGKVKKVVGTAYGCYELLCHIDKIKVVALTPSRGHVTIAIPSESLTISRGGIEIHPQGELKATVYVSEPDPKPDLQPVKIEIIQNDKSVTCVTIQGFLIKGIYENNGCVDVESGYLNIIVVRKSDNKKVSQWSDTIQVNAGETAGEGTSYAGGNVAEVDNYTVKFVLDVNEEIDEKNENNNEMTMDFEVVSSLEDCSK